MQAEDFLNDDFLKQFKDSKSEYYSSSFLLSATTSYQQVCKFAKTGEDEFSANPIVLIGWIPKRYEGILSAPNSRILRRKVDMNALGLPVYERRFFHKQEEIILKSWLLTHYLLGCLRNVGKEEQF